LFYGSAGCPEFCGIFAQQSMGLRFSQKSIGDEQSPEDVGANAISNRGWNGIADLAAHVSPVALKNEFIWKPL
jgi:hypothetical protein